MLPFTYRYFPKRMNFAINPPSNKINKFSLTILSQKHAHCEPFSSLPFLLFNKYENGLESERESVQINSSGFRFNVTFVDCTSVFVKSVFGTSLSFTCLYCVDADNGWDGVSPAVCTLPMVRCGSSPVARLYHAKNEAPGEEAVSAILNNYSSSPNGLWVNGRDPFNQNSNRSDREKRTTSKGGPVFSKLFRLDRTDPLSFGPKFPESLVEWIAPNSPWCRRPHGLLIQRPWGRKE